MPRVSSSAPLAPGGVLDPRAHRRLIALTAVRSVAVATVIVVVYSLLPATRDVGSAGTVLRLAAGLAVIAAALGWQVRAITRAEHPVLRSTEAVAGLIPLHLAVFAHVHLSISRTHPTAFTEVLDHISALYFTVTVFATVGFGDIAPRSDGARLVAIVQMALNLVLLGAGIRLLFAAARRGPARTDGPVGPSP